MTEQNQEIGLVELFETLSSSQRQEAFKEIIAVFEDAYALDYDDSKRLIGYSRTDDPTNLKYGLK